MENKYLTKEQINLIIKSINKSIIRDKYKYKRQILKDKIIKINNDNISI